MMIIDTCTFIEQGLSIYGIRTPPGDETPRNGTHALNLKAHRARSSLVPALVRSSARSSVVRNNLKSNQRLSHGFLALPIGNYWTSPQRTRALSLPQRFSRIARFPNFSLSPTHSPPPISNGPFDPMEGSPVPSLSSCRSRTSVEQSPQRHHPNQLQ
jgi:hypothetical protein